MELLTWGRSPWGEWVLTHVSWSLFLASLFAGALFFLARASWAVTHGLTGVGLVGLVIAHGRLAVRPDESWIPKSMLVDWITQRQYLEHHEPSHWPQSRGPGASNPAGQV